MPFSFTSGGGYVVDLSFDYSTSINILEELKNISWISQETKALIVETTVYNGNINLFTLIKLVCESTDSGRIFVYPRIQSFRLYTYVGAAGILVISCQVIWVLLLVYFIVREALEIKKQRCRYFKNLWNLGHLLHLVLAVTSVILFLARIPHIMDSVNRVHNEHGS